LSETTPTPAEVGADREAVRPETGRDVADREVGVVEEDHRRTLGVGELSKRCQEIRISIVVDVFTGSGRSWFSGIACFHRAGGDPESGTPCPCGWVTDGRTSFQDLGEGLGYRVAGDVRVAGEGEDGAPESFGVGPVDGLDALTRF
jgi:hypothetical protein